MTVRCSWAFALLIAAAALGAGCRSAGREVVVYLSIDQPFTEPILRDYERQSGVKVRAVWDRRGLAPGSSVLPARPREVGVTAVVIAAGSALLFRRRP